MENVKKPGKAFTDDAAMQEKADSAKPEETTALGEDELDAVAGGYLPPRSGVQPHSS